jgi:hypothetical protein
MIARSRDKASLEPISAKFGVQIKKTPLGDYPYRVEIRQEDFAEWVRDQASSIDYRNFKSEVAINRGSTFSRALGKVWSTMHDVEDSSARERNEN